MDETIVPSDLKPFLAEAVQERIPFNKLVGIELESLEAGNVRLLLRMREDLIGNFVHGTLHGGVISTVLDAVGGLTCWLSVLQRIRAESTAEKLKSFGRIGTIDIRVDYLRPGRGACFYARGVVLRTGNKVAVTRMELRDERDVLIAVGTGTYIVG